MRKSRFLADVNLQCRFFRAIFFDCGVAVVVRNRQLKIMKKKYFFGIRNPAFFKNMKFIWQV